MKLTKSRLQQIIKEELKIVLEGDDWYDDEHETMADRKFADRPDVSSSGRPFRTGVPPEDVLKHGADTEKYPTTPEELESDRIADELENAWVDAGNDRRDLGFVDNEILDMAMAVRDGDMEMEDALDQLKNLKSRHPSTFDDFDLDEGKPPGKKHASALKKGSWSKKERKAEQTKERHGAKQALKKQTLKET